MLIKIILVVTTIGHILIIMVIHMKILMAMPVCVQREGQGGNREVSRKLDSRPWRTAELGFRANETGRGGVTEGKRQG